MEKLIYLIILIPSICFANFTPKQDAVARQEIREIRLFLEDEIANYDSAQFKEVTAGVSSNGAYIFCGRLRAKNIFNTYTMWQNFAIFRTERGFEFASSFNDKNVTLFGLCGDERFNWDLEGDWSDRFWKSYNEKTKKHR